MQILDAMSSRKRKRRSRMDKSIEIDNQEDLGSDIEISENKAKSSRKRKRRSRFDKSSESESDDHLEVAKSKNESEHEKGMSDESDNNDENSYYRPRRKRKKIGRPAGSKTKSTAIDDDYAPHHSQVQHSSVKEKNKSKSKTSDEPEVNIILFIITIQKLIFILYS